MLDRMERVLTDIRTFREDMTVAMAFATRADGRTEVTETLQRAMESQITALRTPIERLEARRNGSP